MIITIDGPAGAGKSSAARTLAERLGFEFLDTGAMYRAVTLMVVRHAIDAADESAMIRLLDAMDLRLQKGQVVLQGEDVTRAIRAPEVTAASGQVADNPAVRRRLVEWQQAFAQGRNIVTEGRDQGTIVFPQALCKFYLEADPLERARRRQREMAKRGDLTSLDEVLRAQEVRDRRDSERDLAPMRPADDAIRIDSTHCTLEQIVDRMEQEVRRCLTAPLSFMRPSAPSPSRP